MPVTHKILLGLALSLGLSLSSCDDDLVNSPSDQPILSVDTLRMGTLLAGNSSKTHLVKLYNHCAGEIKVSSITLRNAATSGFRMNVDGMNGTSFTNSDLLRIAKGDSLFIFVEATFPINTALFENHMDYIDIFCNQRMQTVVLDAQSQNVDPLHGVTVLSDTVWDSTGLNKHIFDSLVVPQGVTLRIADSVTLYLHDKADIIVRGTLQCSGKLGAPVTIRGDRTDKMFDNLPYDNLPSQWGAMYIDSTAKECRFDYTDIHGMSTGIWIDSTDVQFNSCRLKNSDGNLVTCHMSRLKLYNSELSNAAGALLDLYGGWNDVVHCTLANYNFSKTVTSPALRFSNIDTAQVRPTPLHHCLFQNVLVWGKWSVPEKDGGDVRPDYFRIMVDVDRFNRPVYADSIFCYNFDHCMLHANGTDDNDFIQTIWNRDDNGSVRDPKFKLIDTPNYTFDFHLEKESPARKAGSSEGAQTCPLDLDGTVRSGLPSIGCYE